MTWAFPAKSPVEAQRLEAISSAGRRASVGKGQNGTGKVSLDAIRLCGEAVDGSGRGPTSRTEDPCVGPRHGLQAARDATVSWGVRGPFRAGRG